MVVAHIHLMSQIGARVTLAELAERTGKAHGKRSFSQGQMTDYQKGKVIPPLEVIWAYSKACSVDPGWLAFGADTNATPPPGFLGVPDTPLSPVPRKGATKKRR